MIKSHIKPDYIYIHSFTPSDHKRVGYNRLQLNFIHQKVSTDTKPSLYAICSALH